MFTPALDVTNAFQPPSGVVPIHEPNKRCCFGVLVVEPSCLHVVQELLMCSRDFPTFKRFSHVQELFKKNCLRVDVLNGRKSFWI
jgi:hypothetical protein